MAAPIKFLLIGLFPCIAAPDVAAAIPPSPVHLLSFGFVDRGLVLVGAFPALVFPVFAHWFPPEDRRR